MNYLIYNTKALSKSKSMEVATSLGCKKNPDDITTEWFRTIEHPTLPFAALCIPNNQQNLLTNQEINRLKSREFMIQQGWFPELEK